MKMVLKTLSVGELRSPNSTARQHNRQQRKKARALFSEHGIVVPIIVDERMRIIDGILRFEIAKELGLQELNAVVVSGAKEEELLQGAVRLISPSICPLPFNLACEFGDKPV